MKDKDSITTLVLTLMNTQLKELFDNSYDLIQVFNEKGEFIFVNKAWKNRLGYKDEEIKSLNFQEVVNHTQWEETHKKLDSIVEGSLLDRFSSVLTSKSGRDVFVSGAVSCSVDDQGVKEYRGIFYDITERIRAERAQSIYYKIANLAISKSNLNLLYNSIYIELNSILKVQNLTITLKGASTKRLRFPFMVNEDKTDTEQRAISELLSAYALERQKPCIIYDSGIGKLAAVKGIDLGARVPKIWLGAQILHGGNVNGILSFYSYSDRGEYNHKDLELLDFVAGQISLALERKFHEEEIIDQRARLNSIFESSTHQIWSIDKAFKYTSFNMNYAEDLEELHNHKISLGSSHLEFLKTVLDEDTQGLWLESYEGSFDGEVTNFQYRFYDGKGVEYWKDVYLNPIIKDNGIIDEVSVIANDITEKRNTELAVAESEEKFRNIFESFQDIYFRCDLNGKITMFSPSVQEVVNLAPEEVLGMDIRDFFKSDAKVEEIVSRLYKEKRISGLETTYNYKKSRKQDFLCNIRLIERNGEPVWIEGVARDITKIKKVNKALKKAKELAERSLRIKERFLANMSHEIRTPMNGIIGMIDLIANTNLDGEQFNYVKTIKKSSETLLNILNDILDLSKIEAGKMELKKKPISLSNTIEKLYDLYCQQASINGTDLFYHLPTDLPDLMMVDETRLLQILSNLTSNAIKFSDGKGNISIALKTVSHSKELYTFKVQVRDSGIGISKKNQAKLFSNFNQLDNSSSKNYKGTGLGLAISKELVRSMNGDIGVNSTPGLGSTFWFTFDAETPMKKDLDDYKEVDGMGQGISRELAKTNPHILLVDDNTINRTVAGEILKKSGCKVDAADSGHKALEMVQNTKYDLVFMDIQMPGMDGVTATRKIKRLGLTQVPPIVAMTAYSMEEDQKRFLRNGLDDYLPKPIQAHSLINKVKDWVEFDYNEMNNDIFEEKAEDLIINQNKLNQLHKYGGDELIQSVLSDFELETSEILKRCHENLKSANFEEIRNDLHTLKGNAGTLGIEKMAKHTAALEKNLKQNIFAGLNEHIEELSRLFAEFQINHKNILNQ